MQEGFKTKSRVFIQRYVYDIPNICRNNESNIKALQLINILGQQNFFILIEDKEEPVFCKGVDCEEPTAKEICPITCLEEHWCKFADCTIPDAKIACPKTCDEPSWCHIADCRKPHSIEMCKATCQKCVN